LAAVAALVGCGGNASSSPALQGSQQQGGGGSHQDSPCDFSGVGPGCQSGGMSGSGGRAGQGGAAPTDCDAAVTFRFVGNAAADNLCLGKPGTCAGGAAWLEVQDAAGQAVWLSQSCAMASCSECQQSGCPTNCPQSTPFPEDGVAIQWNGVRWTGGQTCGATNLQCVTPACAAAGSYTARFCAFELPGAGGAGNDPNTFNLCELDAATTPTCVEVPFELPGAGIVEGELL
jgi:hypothetical protein